MLCWFLFKRNFHTRLRSSKKNTRENLIDHNFQVQISGKFHETVSEENIQFKTFALIFIEIILLLILRHFFCDL